MADESLPLVEPVRSPWRERLFEALAHVQRDLLMVGPYIKDDVVIMIKNTLAMRSNPQPLTLRVITRALPDDFLSGASDIAALQHLLAWPTEFARTSVEIRVINNVHAKVWAFDASLAIVGSGNATFPGLEDNLEYGLAIAEPRLIEQILRDWQEWWEQASPVDANELEELRLWLDAIESDAEIRSAEKMTQEKRQAVERRIGAAPHIGRRLVVARSERRGKQAISERQVSYRASHPHSDLHAPEAPHDTSHIPQEVVSVPASYLSQALHWTTPLASGEPYLNSASGTFLKITTKPVTQERQLLQCTWADGKRYSQATIHGQTRERPFWTITLGSSAVQQLIDFLQHASEEMAPEDQSPPELYLWWRPSPSSFFVSHAYESSIPVAIPCMPASTPSYTSVLRPPLSQMTVEQELLLTGLMTLKQQWENLYSDASSLDMIEMSFGSPGTVPTMTLSVGPIEAPLVVSMPSTGSILSGPEIRLRLDFASFQHVIASAHDRIYRWRLCVGRDADAVQFITEFDHEMAWANSLIWVHELRDVAGG